ncbi:hypothetical protein T4B_4720, partial [Trichinella pseudospiralis]
MQITIAIKVRYYQQECTCLFDFQARVRITQKYSSFLLVSLLFKTVHAYVLIVIFVATLLCDTVKLMKQKKVKARMTPSKSWTTLRRKRDEK